MILTIQTHQISLKSQKFHLFVLLEPTFSFANLILSGQDIDWRQKYLKPRVSHAIYKWLFLTNLVPGSSGR